MKKTKSKFLNRLLALLMALALVLTGLPAGSMTAGAASAVDLSSATAEPSAAAGNGLADNVQDGAILHCWCWSFDTIKENMKDIAEAGFSTIQTSPANECNDSYPNMKIMGNDTVNGTDGCWWWHYQPTDWTIGNYQLGTRAQFQAMCDEAERYGIKVLVDVIPNHTTPDLDKVSQSLYNAVGGQENLYHANGFNAIQDGGDWSWGNRLACTTGMMGGLPDVNTENADFQAYFLQYLNDLIDCGADGFRYDTAKHIGVPSDPTDSKSERNDFWPVVTGQESVKGVSLKNSNQMFTYGEVLQGSNVPETEYAQYMRMTASSFGYTLRSAVQNRNFHAGTIKDLQHSTPSRLVTWVESHDTYCNAGESSGLTDTQIRLAWAVVAARRDGTPLFFSRPDGSNGASGNRWGNNVIGARGNDQFKSTEVKTVNFFRNAMAGQPENITNPTGSSQILQIDRGTLGTCIINLGASDASLNNVATTMADGTYKDQVSGSTFTVSGGKLTGTVGRESVAVVYNPSTAGSRIYATAENGAASFSGETLKVTLSAVNATDTKYTTSEGASGSFQDGDVITIGTASKEGDTITLKLSGTGEGGSLAASYTFKKTGKNVACISLPAGWDTPYCYVYNTAGAKNAVWPGVKMEKNADGNYEYEVPDNIPNPLVSFYGGDNSRRYPADMEEGLALAGKMLYIAGQWVDYDNQPDPWSVIDGSYDIYIQKPSGWGNQINCYAYESETSSNAPWPGEAMTDLGEGVFGYHLPDGWKDAKILFNDGANQYPASAQPGLEYEAGISMAYVNGEWQEVLIKPSVTASLADQSGFDTESETVTLTLKNAEKGTYCVDNGPVKEFTGSVDVVIGRGKIADTDITLQTTAAKGGKTAEHVFTYHKEFNYMNNGGYTRYDKNLLAKVREASSRSALGGKYATNPSGQKGANKTISGASDFDDSMIIAQGVANDDPRIFRGSHEGPVYDTYALYGAWDDANIYLGWQYTNVTDVVDPAQGYPISDNGKPYNGDLPQMLVFNLGAGNAGNGLLEDGGFVWGLQVDYETPIDAMMCFSSKPGVGTPALFTADANGSFSYDVDACVGFGDAGISYTCEDGFFGTEITGIKGNGYSGYVPSMLLDATSDWTNFLNEGHSTDQDTFYTMTIPMASLDVTKDQIETNGIGVMHISTFGESGIGSLPMDMTMLDAALLPYSQDASTSAEKEDIDTISVPLAQLGAESSDPTPDPSKIMTVNFGADRSSPQMADTKLLLKAIAAGGDGTYTYQFLVDGKEVQNSESSEFTWKARGGDHVLKVVVTDGSGVTVACRKDYTVDGESPADPVIIQSLVSGSVRRLYDYRGCDGRGKRK